MPLLQYTLEAGYGVGSRKGALAYAAMPPPFVANVAKKFYDDNKKMQREQVFFAKFVWPMTAEDVADEKDTDNKDDDDAAV